jgi:dTDP-4-amino-4,6-dideoxygalactose transaminase
MTSSSRRQLIAHTGPSTDAQVRRVVERKRHNLDVVEDAARADDGLYDGRVIGSLGDATCFGSYPGMGLGACGDAGAVVTSDDDLAMRRRTFLVTIGSTSAMCGTEDTACCNATAASQEIPSLPMYPELTREQGRAMCDSILEAGWQTA